MPLLPEESEAVNVAGHRLGQVPVSKKIDGSETVRHGRGNDRLRGCQVVDIGVGALYNHRLLPQ